MKKVLICDDEADIRQVLGLLLELEFEAEIVQACNGEEAILLLTKEDFDLVICDMHMPKLNGDAVFKFNQENKNIPFVLLSGSMDLDTWHKLNFSKPNSANLLLSKPWSNDDLFVGIKKLLAA